MSYVLVPQARLVRMRAGQVGVTTELDVGDDVVRVALRAGSVCDEGILIDEIFVDDLNRGSEIRRADEDGKALRAVARARDTDRFEQAIPGSTRRQRQNDTFVDQALDVLLDELDARASLTLALPLDVILLAHWQAMGGRVPYPV